MKLDREYQLHILKCLENHFPLPLDWSESDSLRGGKDDETFAANIVYLEQHGLIESGAVQIGIDRSISIDDASIQITHRGMDFLADDGGLSAILGVVTIKLHGDTLKELVSLKIEQSNLTQADKSIWLDALKKLPAEATKHLAVKLMDAGLTHAPDALQQVGSILGFHWPI